jgi:hypothetical protein
VAETSKWMSGSILKREPLPEASERAESPENFYPCFS